MNAFNAAKLQPLQILQAGICNAQVGSMID